VKGVSKSPPDAVTLEAVGARVKQIDPGKLLGKRGFARASGVGSGVFGENRLLAAGELELGPRRPTRLRLGFDHSNLNPGEAVILHGAQFDTAGRPEGGITIVAVAPR
jgi:hypothetical protein